MIQTNDVMHLPAAHEVMLRERRNGITQTHSRHTYLRYGAFAGMLVLATIVIISISYNFKSLLGFMQLWPEPEYTTELYFDKPDKLTRTITPGVAFPIRFTIHNRQETDVLYSYVITQHEPATDVRSVLSQGTLAIDKHTRNTETVDVTPADTEGMSKFSVEVTYKLGDEATTTKREISYWVTPQEGT